MKPRFLYLILAVTLSWFCACKEQAPQENTGFCRFLHEKCLYVTLESGSADYFLYRGQPMGFELELIESFAAFTGCRFVILPGESIASQLKMLEEGKTDIIASNLNITRSRQLSVAFSHPIYHSKQALVQLAPAYLSDSAVYVDSWEALSQREVSVRKNSVFEESLLAYNLPLPKNRRIRIHRSSRTEDELIQAVSQGKLSYSLVSCNKAAHWAFTRPQIDFHLQSDHVQPIAWAMHLKADTLQELVNRWIDSLSATGTVDYLYHKYYEIAPEKTVRSVKSGFTKMDSVSFRRRMAQREMLIEEGLLDESDSAFIFDIKRRSTRMNPVMVGGRSISPYDRLFKKHSRQIPWDWRLLAALVYQESQFESHLVSKKGAIGLMQMIPATARRYGITVRSSAEDQIEAGVKYIRAIYRSLPEEIAAEEQVYFVLAAYNIGLGHILDARRLAAKYGADPNRWYDNVETYLKLKSRPEYYRDTASRNGYANGPQAVDFVRKIDERYMHYRNLVQ